MKGDSKLLLSAMRQDMGKMAQQINHIGQVHNNLAAEVQRHLNGVILFTSRLATRVDALQELLEFDPKEVDEIYERLCGERGIPPYDPPPEEREQTCEGYPPEDPPRNGSSGIIIPD